MAGNHAAQRLTLALIAIALAALSAPSASAQPGDPDDPIAEAATLIEAGNAEDAIKLLERAAKKDKSTALRMALARARIAAARELPEKKRSKHYKAAVKDFDGILKDEPENREALIAAIETQLESGDHKGALSRVKEQIESAGETAEWRIYRARCALAAGKGADAEKDLRGVIEAGGEGAIDARSWLADALIDQGKFDDAWTEAVAAGNAAAESPLAEGRALGGIRTLLAKFPAAKRDEIEKPLAGRIAMARTIRPPFARWTVDDTVRSRFTGGLTLVIATNDKSCVIEIEQYGTGKSLLNLAQELLDQHSIRLMTDATGDMKLRPGSVGGQSGHTFTRRNGSVLGEKKDLRAWYVTKDTHYAIQAWTRGGDLDNYAAAIDFVVGSIVFSAPAR
jgi:tetratricopeptide (TPR) repeat protein